MKHHRRAATAQPRARHRDEVFALGSAYEEAWAEWAANDDSAAWDTTSVDGHTDATG